MRKWISINRNILDFKISRMAMLALIELAAYMDDDGFIRKTAEEIRTICSWSKEEHEQAVKELYEKGFLINTDGETRISNYKYFMHDDCEIEVGKN